MPVLTKDQIVEAVFELPEAQQAELVEQIRERAYPLNLTEEQKNLIRLEIEAHRRDPSTSISREELMTKMRAML